MSRASENADDQAMLVALRASYARAAFVRPRCRHRSLRLLPGAVVGSIWNPSDLLVLISLNFAIFAGMGGAYFVWLNRGKESVVLDLKDAADAALLHRMIAAADVFVQNLAPGAAARAGPARAFTTRSYPRNTAMGAPVTPPAVSRAGSRRVFPSSSVLR